LGHHESVPQQQKNTDPDVLNNRPKTKYSNDNIAKKQADEDDSIFDADIVDNNSWLSYFLTQNDSVIGSLKWDFQEEREVPKFLQSERESIDYSSNDNGKYLWRDNLPEKRPESFPPRQSDPGFMYYHNGGIRVEANMAGIPIYIDGKYVGETPLSRPVQVEPGWHQVSGFSPVYTHLAFRKGLQFVGYDSIIQNNELYGSTTVYAEAGKLETVELKFNQMGDTPKKWNEINGGMNIGTPILLFLMGFIMWGMG
ncbi:MAG: PEGA domain-containing protein, partial [Candidatus Marinimicrobia bacterium]|nr:PEGA domain-containing protein [Candidatus Neomarinimicrobiota bacterium]